MKKTSRVAGYAVQNAHVPLKKWTHLTRLRVAAMHRYQNLRPDCYPYYYVHAAPTGDWRLATGPRDSRPATRDSNMIPEFAQLGGGTRAVRRLGLATRGNGLLEPVDVLYAIDRGVNYLNWCAHPDGMSRAIRSLSRAERSRLVIAAQFSERSAAGFLRELDDFLQELNLDCIDVATFYYVESEGEWDEIAGPGGALEAARRAQVEGRIRVLGITTHQRPLAAERARRGELDVLMIRYNAAHRGAENDVFPAAARQGTAVIAFTALRWRALLEPTRLDPPGVAPPQPVDCYRFVLSNPHVSVVLAAPGNRAELEADLALLDNWRELTVQERCALCDHGDRVRQTAGRFP